MTRNHLLYIFLRGAAPLVRILPLPVVYSAARLVGSAAYFVVAPARRAILENLSIVCGSSPDDPDVRRAARAAFRVDAQNWVDSLRIRHIGREQLLSLIDLDGWEHVEVAMEGGHGLVVVAMHLGNVDLVGQVFAAKGYHVTIPVERVDPPELFQFLTASRRSQGIDIVPIDRAPRAMIRALRAGNIVGIAGDRGVTGRTIGLPFFGKFARLPSSAAHLARRENAPVVVAAGIRRPGERFRGIIIPVELEKTDDEQSDERENTRRIVVAMEELIRQHPEQWLVFSPVWRDDKSLDSAATIGQRTEAVRQPDTRRN